MEKKYTELLIGCGNSRKKKLTPIGAPHEWQNLVTLDIDPDCNPDLVFDLQVIESDIQRLPFADSSVDEIHAYEILEHFGYQGNWRGFFRLFAEFHRVLVPGGFICATCPSVDSRWAWGDPGHCRVIMPETLVFLSQQAYREQIGKTNMTDYRHVWKGDFEVHYSNDNNGTHAFILTAIK